VEPPKVRPLPAAARGASVGRDEFCAEPPAGSSLARRRQQGDTRRASTSSHRCAPDDSPRTDSVIWHEILGLGRYTALTVAAERSNFYNIRVAFMFNPDKWPDLAILRFSHPRKETLPALTASRPVRQAHLRRHSWLTCSVRSVVCWRHVQLAPVWWKTPKPLARKHWAQLTVMRRPLVRVQRLL